MSSETAVERACHDLGRRKNRWIGFGTPRSIYKGMMFTLRGWRPFDVMPDGRFVMIVPNQNDDRRPVAPIVQQNWTEELKRLVPVR